MSRAKVLAGNFWRQIFGANLLEVWQVTEAEIRLTRKFGHIYGSVKREERERERKRDRVLEREKERESARKRESICAKREKDPIVAMNESALF
jgi:hypothetical protein